MSYNPNNPNGATTGSASAPVVTATDDANLKGFATSGAGGYIRQDTNATIAKESGGNLATIVTNTNNIPSKGQATKANSTPVTIASDQGAVTAGMTDTFGSTTAFTITLASLANSTSGVGRQSTLVTGNTARSAQIGIKLKMGTTPTANSLCYVYLIRGDGTLNDDGAGATDAGLTVVNAPLLGTLLCSSSTTGLVLTGIFDTKPLGSLGKSFGIAIVNSSGVALDATAGNFTAEYTPIT